MICLDAWRDEGRVGFPTVASGSKKETIFYARTYRHLDRDLKRQLAFVLLLVLPAVVLYLLFYRHVTYAVSSWASGVLAEALGAQEAYPIGAHEYIPFFGPVSYVALDSSLPSMPLVLGTAFACLALCVVLTLKPVRGLPVSIFLLFGVGVQLVSCLFFFIDGSVFPYGETDYSVLYMIQQAGIWLFFIIIAGLVVGLISYGGLALKLATYAGILLYSFVFGAVRYVVYLYIVARFSSLFMATLFFSLGPFFDFLYLVFFYSLFVDRLNAKLNRRDRTEVWRWA